VAAGLEVSSHATALSFGGSGNASTPRAPTDHSDRSSDDWPATSSGLVSHTPRSIPTSDRPRRRGVAILRHCIYSTFQNGVVRWRWLPGHVGEPLRCHASTFLARHPLPDPEPETGRPILRALLPPSFTCSSVQAFILPATCEYCVDGLRMAEEAFLRAKTEAAPARGADRGDRGSEQGSPARRYMKISWRIPGLSRASRRTCAIQPPLNLWLRPQHRIAARRALN
jgi:hypothetical protein